MNDQVKISLKWSAIGLFVVGIITSIWYVFNLSYGFIYSLIPVFVIIVIGIASIYEFRDKANNGQASFRMLFSFGILIVLFLAVFLASWENIEHRHLNEKYYDDIAEKSIEYLTDLGLSEEEIMIQVASQEALQGSQVKMFLGYLMYYVFVGMLVVLPTSIILRKEELSNSVVQNKE